METIYAIHSKVRDVQSRSSRAAAPQRARLVQRVGGNQQRVIRGRPLHVTDEFVTTHLEELKAKVAQGLIELRTLSGALVDVSSRASTPTEVPSMPFPDFPLDDAKKDKPAGMVMPSELGYNLDAQGNLLEPGAKPLLLDQAPSEASLADPTLEAAIEAATLDDGEESVTPAFSQGKKGKKGR